MVFRRQYHFDIWSANDVDIVLFAYGRRADGGGGLLAY
jgi:hypothetical protein